MTTPTTQPLERQRNNWRWFPLVYLIFLGFPIVGLFGTARPWFEYVVGTLILAGFATVFLLVFWLRGESTRDLEQPLRPRSLIGWACSYAAMGLMWPLIGSDGLGFLIYGASMAGFQTAVWPMALSILLSAAGFGVIVRLENVSALSALFNLIFAVVAAGGTHLGYLEILAARRLRKSQEEVARIAKIAERERIARDLHDLLGHTLSVIVLKSELASKLAEKNPARAAEEIHEVERIARESLQEVRSAVRGYRSAGLEGEFANVSLALEAAQVKLETYITPLELEWSHEQALAFCLRESITNVIRHARAKRCWVNLEKHGDVVMLEIWDDGGGKITEGNGVRGMRERAESLGGTLETTTSAGYAGISLRIPLTPLETQAATAGLGLEGA